MHDGFTMIKGRDFGKVKQRCEQIVREKLKEKGICSGLEWSE
jgi:hypothetical protein